MNSVCCLSNKEKLMSIALPIRLKTIAVELCLVCIIIDEGYDYAEMTWLE